MLPPARTDNTSSFSAGEEIFRELVPLGRIPELVREARITHALVVAAFHLLDLDPEWAERAGREGAG